MKQKLLVLLLSITAIITAFLVVKVFHLNIKDTLPDTVRTKSLIRNSTSTTYSTPPNLTTPQVMRENCPEGFTFFDNDDFSICYPADTTQFYPETKLHNIVDGKPNNLVSFGHSNVLLEVLPIDGGVNEEDTYSCYNESGECTPPPCWLNKESVVVSGLPATRKVFRSIIYPGVNKCGKIIEIKTMVDRGSKYAFLLRMLIAYGENETPSLNLDRYRSIEKSLKIKF